MNMIFKQSIYSPNLFLFNILHPPSLFIYVCLCVFVDVVNKFKTPV